MYYLCKKFIPMAKKTTSKPSKVNNDYIDISGLAIGHSSDYGSVKGLKTVKDKAAGSMHTRKISKYIEVEVPLQRDAAWFQQLRESLSQAGVSVKWQDAHYHITLAFITRHPLHANLFLPMSKSVSYKVGPFLTFDKLDVFTTPSGQHIIYLTSSHPTPEFQSLVQRVREEYQAVGCVYSTDFKLHVTLGRVDASLISLDELQQLVSQVTVPPFTFQLFNVNLLYYTSHRKYYSDVMYPDEESAKIAEEERIRRAFRNAGGNFQLYADPDI